MHERKSKVIGLIRVSSEQQAEEDRAGIPRQREVINRTIKANNLECIEMIELSDVSGTTVAKSYEIQRVLKMVSTRVIDGIAIADIDRLIRPDQFEDFALLQVFQDAEATLFCGDQKHDLSTDSGYLNTGFQALMAGNEVRTLKRRVHGAKESKRQEGRLPTTTITLPMGISYDRNKEKQGLLPTECWSYNSEVQPVVEAFRLVDEEGITNLSELGRRVGIHHRTLRNQLRNELYTGWRVYDHKRGKEKYPSKNGKAPDRKKVKRTADEIIRVRVLEPGAVDQERFNRVNKLLNTTNGNWSESRKGGTKHLLTGVGFCGHCGERLYCNSGKRKDRKSHAYYYCKQNDYLNRRKGCSCELKNKRQDATDEKVAEFVSKELTKPSFLNDLLTSYHKVEESKKLSSENTVVDWVSEGKKLKRRFENIENDYLEGSITADQFNRVSGKLAEKIKEAEANQRKTPLPPSDDELTQAISRLARGALAFNRIQDPAKQKVAIRQLFSKIHVTNDGISGISLMRQPEDFFDTEVGIHMDKGSSPRPT
ncbi:recombinase family protein [Kiritimatiellota bacterium B12222]|nr:recombinase family protein [Kiritimatiellota bacterium B12222]